MDWTWGENVGEALAAIAVGYAARSSREWFIARQGQLSGYWLWITYYKGNAYNKDDRKIWSIEIARLGHRTRWKEEQLRGTVWRLYDRDKPTNWKRRWSFIGWKTDGVVEGVYKWTRDQAGSHGVIHVWQTDQGFDGIYVRLTKEHARTNLLSTVRDEAPTKWRRLPDPMPPKLRAMISAIPNHRATESYPARVRRKLGINSTSIENLPYAGPMGGDNQLILIKQRLREEEDARAREEDKPPLSDDDLGL